MAYRLIQIIKSENRSNSENIFSRAINYAGFGEEIPSNVKYPDLYFFEIYCPKCMFVLKAITGMQKTTTMKYICTSCGSKA